LEEPSLSPLLIQNSNGKSIHSVDDWFGLAPPKKGRRQWKGGRSAKELAKAWFRTERAKVPEELEALFKSHSSTKDLVLKTAIPEKQTILDGFGGEPRNNDLILIGRASGAPVVVGIEAKADEPFGPIIQEYLKEKKGTKSKVPDRIKLLLQSIFGRPIDENLGRLRYQLLHGLAGTIIEAKQQGASQAIFVVHEFISEKTKPEKIEQNKVDFERFINSFPQFETYGVSPGILMGPLRVRGGEFVPNDIPVLIGKVTTNLVKK
jgi:hypothetical protein